MAGVGNLNASKRPFADAIRRALARYELENKPQSINGLAEVLVRKAHEGDMAAIKELADRLDGRPAQAVNIGGDEENPLIHKAVVEYVHPPGGAGYVSTGEE